MKDMESHSAPDMPLPSNRKFGGLFTAIFTTLGLIPLIRHPEPHWLLLGIGLAFGAVTTVFPKALTPLNWAWTKLGLIMHAVVSPVILGVLYYGLLTPIGLIMRMLGKDPMRRRLDPQAKTYWITRETRTVTRDSLSQQF